MPDQPPSFTVDCEDPFDLATGVVRETLERFGCSSAPSRVTIDRGADVVDRADVLSVEELEEACAFLVEDGILDADWRGAYLDRAFEIEGLSPLRFTPDVLQRAAVKFGWALAGCEESAVAGAELAFPTERAVTELEHLFLGLELRRRGMRPAAVALRLPGVWEPAIDFDGDAAEVESTLAGQVAVARHCGAYRLSVRHAAEKFTLLPMLGRIGGDRLHLDLSGACWLEAMRTLARGVPVLFRSVLAFAQEQFCLDRDGSFLSTSEEDVRSLPLCDDAALEALFLDDPRGRQLLHVTRRSFFADPGLHPQLTAALTERADVYRGLVSASLERHFLPEQGR